MNVRALFKGWWAKIFPGCMIMGMTSWLFSQETREK